MAKKLQKVHSIHEIETIKTYDVESSNVACVGYSEGFLKVIYRNSPGIYVYIGVEENVYSELYMNNIGGSVGSYINKNIKPNYFCIKM